MQAVFPDVLLSGGYLLYDASHLLSVQPLHKPSQGIPKTQVQAEIFNVLRALDLIHQHQ
jgi:hypothetical protein